MPPLTGIPAAIAALQAGRMILLLDDENRENEGDLVIAAEKVRAEDINFMSLHGRGLICLALSAERVSRLGLAQMTEHNRTQRQTAFTVSIEARTGVTTGVSAHDRAHTVLTAIAANATDQDLISPGHIFPLRAQPGGVLVRAGHTEGSVDLAIAAGLQPGAVICEVMSADGTMARRPELKEFSLAHQIPIVTIAELIAWRRERESLVTREAEAILPTAHATFRAIAFRSTIDGTEHLALALGSDAELSDHNNPPLVRMHSECLTGDVLGSQRCDCGEQLRAAQRTIAQAGRGLIVYMRNQEGRGIGLTNKIRAYHLQDHGLDTVDANQKLGFAADLRHYGIGAQILRSFGLRSIRLLTNNPRKIVGLESHGLEIAERVPLLMTPNTHSQPYLTTKRQKLGHLMNELTTHKETPA